MTFFPLPQITIPSRFGASRLRDLRSGEPCALADREVFSHRARCFSHKLRCLHVGFILILSVQPTCLAAPQKDLSADLKSSDQVVRRKALRALAHPESKDVLNPKYVDILIPIANESDTLTKWNAVEALANIGPPAKAALPSLLKCLDEPPGPDRNMRALVANAVARIGHDDPNVVKTLSAKLLVGDLMDADAFANALASIGKAALPRLLAGLRAPSLPANYAAVRALRRLGKDASPAIPELIDIANDKKRSGAIPALRGGNLRNAAMRTLMEIAPDDKTVLASLNKIAADTLDVPACADAQAALKNVGKH